MLSQWKESGWLQWALDQDLIAQDTVESFELHINVFAWWMIIHKEFTLACGHRFPFWAPPPLTLQQDKHSLIEQHSTNIFASQEQLFVLRPITGLIISDCPGQRKQREQFYKGSPLKYKTSSCMHIYLSTVHHGWTPYCAFDILDLL